MKNIYLLNLVFVALILSSCESGLKKTSTTSTGRNGEILVVSDRDLWRGDLKDTITNFFTKGQYGLPQPEPRFSVFSLPVDEFNRILRPHRSILMVSVDKSLKKAKVSFDKDKWAMPQVVVKLTGSTRESLVEEFWLQRDNIADLFLESEYRGYQKVATETGEPSISKELEERYHFSMTFPKDYSIGLMLENFCWIRKEAKEFSNGILVYTYDYTDAKSMDPKNILFIRDTIIKAHIPGPNGNSYMAVSSEFKPQSKVIDFMGNNCVETRGLWLFKNEFMEGPFVNYTFIDKARKKVVVLDGYVYAPRDNKRDMLRSVEAVLHTWKDTPKAVKK
jgi:hypothetical protein